MPASFGKLDLFLKQLHFAVNSHTNEPLVPRIFEYGDVLTLLVGDDRGEDQNACASGQSQYGIGDLLD